MGMSEHRVGLNREGAVVSSAVPSRVMGSSVPPGALNLRGVVVQTYCIDTEHMGLPIDARNVAVYCDVLLYTAIPGSKVQFLDRCLVSDDTGGIAEGRLWRPRAARKNLRTGKRVTADEICKATAPQDLDGDHVLVSFMDNDINAPVIIRGIPHPRSQLGLRVSDGEPDMKIHRGVVWGVDSDGNFTVDAEGAYKGELSGGLQEPGPVNDGASGSVNLIAQPGAQWSLGHQAAAVLGDSTGRLVVSSATSDVFMTVNLSEQGEVIIRRSTADDVTELKLSSAGLVVVTGADSATQTTRTLDFSVTSRDVNLTAERDAIISAAGNVELGAADEAAVLGDALAQAASDLANAISAAGVTGPMTGGGLLAAGAVTAFTNFASAVQSALSATVKLKR